MKLVPIESVSPATYNPRTTDPARLELIQLSLRKLGFLLPIYATQDSEILSGHQRQLAAGRMGVTHVPLVETPSMALEKRRSVNLLFNRATNDLTETDSTFSVSKELMDSNLHELAAELPDKVLNSEEFYPCMKAQSLPIGPVLNVNSGWSDHAAAVSGALYRMGFFLPIVVDPDFVVVNGLGRLKFFAEQDIAMANFIQVSYQEAAFARLMLNRLTMDFDVHGRFADQVRFNNFRRARQRLTDAVGTGYAFLTKTRSLAKLEDRKRFIAAHGRELLDFGAGLRADADHVRQHGVSVDCFEPFVNDGHDNVDADLSRQVTREFLAVVATRKQWSSVFLNFVLNSIPFDQDRRHVLTLVASLSKSSNVFVSTKSWTHPDSLRVRRGSTTGTASTIGFPLEFEPNLIMSELGKKFRTQKFFLPDEFVELLSEYWGFVKLLEAGNYLRAVCRDPKPIPPAQLSAAVEFEFDLPYPDGSRMGLVPEARAAFQAYTGLLE